MWIFDSFRGPVHTGGRAGAGRQGIWEEKNAAFITISALNNAGYTLSSNSVAYFVDNPMAYPDCRTSSSQVTPMTPVIYRFIIFESHTTASTGLLHRTRELQFILDNPRKVSINTLPTKGSYLSLLSQTTTLNVVQYIFYLASCLDCEQTREYGSQTTLAGIGFFQTISTRNAGRR